MNYIEEAEKVLRYYHGLSKSIGYLDRQIARLVARVGPHNLSAMHIEETGVRSSHNDEMNNTIFQIRTLTKSRLETEEKLTIINQLLDDISEDQGCELFGKVLKLWYIERMRKEDIAEEIGYSPTSRQSIYDLRDKAIREFAVTYFGIAALKAV